MRRSGRTVDNLWIFRWRVTDCASTGPLRVQTRRSHVHQPRRTLQPIWAFVLSALLSVVAFLVAGYSAAASPAITYCALKQSFVPCWRVVLLAIFSWLLAVGNHVEDHRIAAQGLPLISGMGAQFGLGCGIGLLLVIVAVVPVGIWGGVSFRTTHQHVQYRRGRQSCLAF